MPSISEVTRQQLIEARERRAKEGKADVVAKLDQAIAKKDKLLSQQGTLQQLKRHAVQGVFSALAGGAGGVANALDLAGVPGEETADSISKYLWTPGINTETDPKATDIGEIKDFGSGAMVLGNLVAQGVGSVGGYLGLAAGLGLAARAAPVLAPLAPYIPPAVLFAMSMGEARQAQEDAGIKDKHAGAAAAAAVPMALLERLGLEGPLGKKVVGQAVKKTPQSRAGHMGSITLIEGVTEPGQNIIAHVQANLVAGKPWNDGLDSPEKLKELGTEAIAGGLTGLALSPYFYPGKEGGTTPGAPGATGTTTPPPTPPTTPSPKPTTQSYPPTATVGKKPGPMSEVRTTQIPPAKVKELVQNVAGEAATFKKGRWFVPKNFEGPLQETFNSYLESIGARPTLQQRADLAAQVTGMQQAEEEAALVQAQQNIPIEGLEQKAKTQLGREATSVGNYGEDPGLANLTLPSTQSPVGLPLVDPSMGQSGEYIMGLESPDQTIPYYPPNEIHARNLTHAIMYNGQLYNGRSHFDILQDLQQNVMKDPDGTPWAPNRVDAELDKAFVGFTTPSGEFLSQDEVRQQLGTATSAGVAEAALLETVDLRTEATPYIPASPAETQSLRDLHKQGKVSRIMLPGKRKYGYFQVAPEEKQTRQAEAGLVAQVRPVVEPAPIVQPTSGSPISVQGKPQYTGTEPLPNTFVVGDSRGQTLVVPLLDPDNYSGLLADLRAYLDRVLPGAKLSPAKFSDPRMAGLADPVNQIVYYSLEHGQDRFTISHEAVHLAKDKFTDAEWALLSEKSRRKWISEFGIDKQAYTKDERVEEGIAQGYAAFNAGVGKFEPAVRRAFTKLKNFFTEIYNFLRRKGFTSVDDIFRKVESGEIGRRPGGNNTGTLSAQLPSPDFRSKVMEVVESIGDTQTFTPRALEKKFRSAGVTEKELSDRGFQKFVEGTSEVSKADLVGWARETEPGLELFKLEDQPVPSIEVTEGIPAAQVMEANNSSPMYTDPKWRTIPFGRDYRELVIGSKNAIRVGPNHWPSINSPIVHVRLINNTLENGTPVVSIAELQSDAASNLRKYGEKMTREYAAKEITSLRQRQEVLVKALPEEIRPKYVDQFLTSIETQFPLKKLRQSTKVEPFDYIKIITQAYDRDLATNEGMMSIGNDPHTLNKALTDNLKSLEEIIDLSLQTKKLELRAALGVSPLPVPPIRLALRMAIRDAVQRGIGTVAWPGSEEHVRIRGAKNRQGFERVYDEMIPNELKKFAKQYGGELGKSKVVDEKTGDSIPVTTFTIPKGFAREVTGGIYKWQLAQGPHPSPSVSWSTKLVDRATKLRNRFYSVYGELPDIAKIRAIRYLAIGKITDAGDLIQEATTVLKDATEKDKKAILDYFQTPDAVLPALDDPTLGQHITKFKEAIRGVSAKMFELGLITEEQYNTYEDQYLPYVYMWHLLDADQRQAMGSGNRASPLNNTKSRDPELDELTRTVMGQIKDPTYLLAKVFGTQMRDIALIEAANQIAQNEQWVWKDAVVEYNGRPVTTYWLAKTADKIDTLLEHDGAYNTPDARAEAIRRRDEMRALVAQQPGIQYDSKHFTEVPDHPRYGGLAGLPIRNEIYSQFIDSVHMTNAMAASSTGQKFLKFVDQFTQVWKLAKVPLNVPVSFIRAAVGGMVQMHAFGEMPAFAIPGEIARAVKDFRGNGDGFKRAKKWGVVNTTYTTGELAEIERLLTKGQTLKFDPDHLFAPVVGLAESIVHVGARSAKTVADAYGLIDQIYKTAMINYHVDHGMSEQDAALLAHDAIFDYSEIGPMLAAVRKLPIAGSPFMTFTVKAASQTLKMLSKAATNPSAALRLLPYIILPYMATALAGAASGVGDDDNRKVKNLLPEGLRENPYVIPLPYIDAKGGLSHFDSSYFFPWQVLIQLGIIASKVEEKGVGPTLLKGTEYLALAGGSFADLFAAIKTGYDAFTDKPILNEFAPPADQNMQLMAYIWSYLAPPFLAYKPEGSPSGRRGLVQKIVEAHQGKKNPHTQTEYLMPEQAWAGLLGVNVYRTDPVKQRAVALRYRQNQLENIKRTAQKQARSPNLTPEQRKDLMDSYHEFYKTKAGRLRDYADETNFSSKIRDLQKQK